MEKLDLSLRTLFQDYQELVFARVQLEQQLTEEPTYVRKKIKGKTYWYQQWYETGHMKQKYFSPASEQQNQFIAEQRKRRKNLQNKIWSIKLGEKKRTSILKKAGLPQVESACSSVLQHFSQQRLCYQGGVLVGSLAFAAYSSLLGYIFERQTLRTQGIDVVRETALLKYARPIERATLFPQKMQRDISAIPSFHPQQAPASFLGPQHLRIDFLTALRGKSRKTYLAPGMKDVGATALHFLDYLIEDPVHTVLLGTHGGIAVTVPQPARFALHKLMLAARRGQHEQAKAKKDLLQAEQLLQACAAEMPFELEAAYKNCIARGAKWKKLIRQSSGALSDETQAMLKKLGSSYNRPLA